MQHYPLNSQRQHRPISHIQSGRSHLISSHLSTYILNAKRKTTPFLQTNDYGPALIIQRFLVLLYRPAMSYHVMCVLESRMNGQNIQQRLPSNLRRIHPLMSVPGYTLSHRHRRPVHVRRRLSQPATQKGTPFLKVLFTFSCCCCCCGWCVLCRRPFG